MTKTLNQFVEEGYLKVKSSDEQKFIDKHVAVANPDRNGNGDEVFKGAKVKTINRRKERKGYDAGDDEKVYEEAELEEKAPPGAKYERMVKDIKKGYAKDGLTAREKAISYATAWKAKKANEEAEQIDELSKKTLGSYQTKALAGPMDDTVDTKRVARSKRDAGIRLAGKKMYPELAKHNGGKAKVAATEETLIDILAGLKESHIRTMVEVYESLSEENQAKFVATCKKDGGIDAMLNFAIKNRGE